MLVDISSLTGAIMVGIVVIGSVGNFLTLFVLIRYRPLHDVTGMFLANLAVADLLQSTFGMPLIASSAFHNGWRFGDTLCIISGITNSLFCITSMLTLAAISFDRCLAIVRPLNHHALLTFKRARVVLIYIWAHALLVAILPVFGWSRYVYLSYEFICTIQWEYSKAYTIFLTITSFALPLIVTVLSYASVMKVACHQARETPGITVGEIKAELDHVTRKVADSENGLIPHMRNSRVCVDEGHQNMAKQANQGEETHGSHVKNSQPCNLSTLNDEGSVVAEPETSRTDEQLGERFGLFVKETSFDKTFIGRRESGKWNNDRNENSQKGGNNTSNRRDTVKKYHARTNEAMKKPSRKTVLTVIRKRDSSVDPENLVRIPRNYSGKIFGKPGVSRKISELSEITAQLSLGTLPLPTDPRVYCTHLELCPKHIESFREDSEVYRLKRAWPLVDLLGCELSMIPEENDATDSRQGLGLVSFPNHVRPHGHLARVREWMCEKIMSKEKPETVLHRKKEMKVVLTLAVVNGTFVLCWLPHFIGIMCLTFTNGLCPFSDNFFIITTTLAMLNSGCNPFIYTLTYRKFRKAFGLVLPWFRSTRKRNENSVI